MNKLLLLFLLFNAAAGYSQTNLYVDSSISVSGTGASWISACKTLNEALNIANAASSGKYIISIAKGTYYPTGLQSGTNRDSTFFIARGGIQIWGGYPSGGGTRDPAANITHLSADIGIVGNNIDNSYHILLAANIPASADSIIIDGLSFTVGNANGSASKTFNGRSMSRGYGAAVYNSAVGVKMLISNCKFSENSARGGGGVFNDSTQVYIYSCSFVNNTANSGTGGAIDFGFASDSASGIGSCSFFGNSANLGGAVFYQYYSNGSLITKSSFNANTALEGGAIYCAGGVLRAEIRIDSCTFTGNRATLVPSLIGGGGGAISHRPNAAGGPTISRCTFSGNSSSGSGGAIYGAGTLYSFFLSP